MSFFRVNIILLLPSLSFSLPLCHPPSNKDTGTFLLHYPRPAEVSFHVLPRPVVCQVARCQAGLSANSSSILQA